MYLLIPLLSLLMVWRGQDFLIKPPSKPYKNLAVATVISVALYLMNVDPAIALVAGLFTGFVGYSMGHLGSADMVGWFDWVKSAASNTLIGIPALLLCSNYLVAAVALGLLWTKPLWYKLGWILKKDKPWEPTQIGEYGTAVATATALYLLIAFGIEGYTWQQLTLDVGALLSSTHHLQVWLQNLL